MIGRQATISGFHFQKDTAGGENQKKALKCIRHCIERIMLWSPAQAREGFDGFFIENMKLTRFISYIYWPDDIPYGSTRYILSLLYPKQIKIRQKQMVEDIYIMVLNDECQFPHDYFVGSRGFNRYCRCLKYLFENYKIFSSPDEMFDFVNSPEGKIFLAEHKLATPGYQFGIDLNECVKKITIC